MIKLTLGDQEKLGQVHKIRSLEVLKCRRRLKDDAAWEASCECEVSWWSHTRWIFNVWKTMRFFHCSLLSDPVGQSKQTWRSNWKSFYGWKKAWNPWIAQTLWQFVVVTNHASFSCLGSFYNHWWSLTTASRLAYCSPCPSPLCPRSMYGGFYSVCHQWYLKWVWLQCPCYQKRLQSECQTLLVSPSVWYYPHKFLSKPSL